jgi:hypothetical protein
MSGIEQMNPINNGSIGGSTVSILQAISLYSPLITLISILIFSIFSSALNKGLFYILTVICITAIRNYLVHNIASSYDITTNPICDTGKIMPYTGKTYSTFILMYTLCYFVTPMFILTRMNNENMVNPYVIAFFAAYIIFDSLMKSFAMGCIDFGVGFFGDLLAGGLLGVAISLVMFASDKISLMFINELNSNKEVCSVPSKQQFRCSLYKNGEIVGSSVSA